MATSIKILHQLFEYDAWANRKLLRFFEKHSSFRQRKEALKLYFHIFGAQQAWYQRVAVNETKSINIWPTLNLEICEKLIPSLKVNWQDFLKTLDDDTITERVSYLNSKAIQYQTPVCDILHHVIIHGQHHRAQIAKQIRDSTLNPPKLDYIFYTRR